MPMTLVMTAPVLGQSGRRMSSSLHQPQLPMEDYRNRSSSICSTSSSSSSSTNIPASFVEYLSDRSDEDDSRGIDEPQRKRLRVSPVSSSLASSEPEDAFTEFDCELLSQFFELDADQLF